MALSPPHDNSKQTVVDNTAVSASKLCLGGGPFVGGGNRRGLLLLFSQPNSFLGRLDVFLCNVRGGGEYERGARPEN